MKATTTLENAMAALAKWSEEKNTLESQQKAINDAIRKQQQASKELDTLIQSRKALLNQLEEAAAESALTGVDIAKPLQKKVDELDKHISQTSTAVSTASNAVAGLQRRLNAVEADLDAHKVKLPELWAARLEAEGELEIEKYAKLHDQLTAAYAIIMSRGILAARLRGSQFPRLETPFKNRAPQGEPPRFSAERGNFAVEEFQHLSYCIKLLDQAGIAVSLPSGFY